MKVENMSRTMRWVFVLLALSAAHAADDFKSGGPYVPTPQVVVDQMLRMANVGESDFVVDLGSGDGVIVLTAAKQFKAAGMGVDIDPGLAATIAGLVYGFAPYRVARFPQIQILTSFWMPLALLGLHEYLASKKRRWLAVRRSGHIPSRSAHP